MYGSRGINEVILIRHGLRKYTTGLAVLPGQKDREGELILCCTGGEASCRMFSVILLLGYVALQAE